MQIRLNDSSFGEYNKTVIEGTLDEAGDVALPEHIIAATGRHYAFENEYEVVSEVIEQGKYTLTLQVNDLIQLSEIVERLPEFALRSAELYITGKKGE